MRLQFADQTYEVEVFTQPEAFEHVRDLHCPQCGRLTDRNKCVGYVETQKIGYMAVYECRDCLKKYRCHIGSTSRYFKDKFMEDLGLEIWAREDEFAEEQRIARRDAIRVP